MTELVYSIVEHDGGWAYTVDGVFSETFWSRAAAQAEADAAAARQNVPGETAAISWQDARGAWYDEVDDGQDRPFAHVLEEHPAAPAGRSARPSRTASVAEHPGLRPAPFAVLLLVGIAGFVAARVLHRR